MSGPSAPPDGRGAGPHVDRVIEAGDALREALVVYRSAFDGAARALGRESEDAPVRHRGFEILRSDWERTVAAFREAVDRVGTAQKTLARGR
ncbi:MAG: hypothetical protein Q8W51_11980 [Candidatus Palauibacterales bacterium]|nr:hypothetical protein [Candidatus Palauibacterales bacterium]MDP2584635.1 hypothetical protein [Candidatus Palauibacterales bacterium]